MKKMMWVLLAAMMGCGGTGTDLAEQARTTFGGNVSNPTGMLEREAGTRLACALPSVLYVVAIVEDGEVSVSVVAPDGSFSVTVNDDNSQVMIVFVLDADGDGDIDSFEGTLTFNSPGGVVTTITANGGTVDLGTITIGTTAIPSNVTVEFEIEIEVECDEDEDLVPDLFDEDDDNDGIDDDLDEDDNDDDEDGVDDDNDVEIEIEIELDANFAP